MDRRVFRGLVRLGVLAVGLWIFHPTVLVQSSDFAERLDTLVDQIQRPVWSDPEQNTPTPRVGGPLQHVGLGRGHRRPLHSC
jgi:hypothetical protein